MQSALTVLGVKTQKVLGFLNFTKIDVNICIDCFWILYSLVVQPLLSPENQMAFCVLIIKALENKVAVGR